MTLNLIRHQIFKETWNIMMNGSESLIFFFRYYIRAYYAKEFKNKEFMQNIILTLKSWMYDF
jgi:hypothetical protein